MDLPLISVVILTARRPQLLARALQSVKRELPDDFFECLVIHNDGSKNTVSRSDFPCVKEFWLEPCSPGAARNLALRHARGHWILFLDDDAFLPPDFFSRLQIVLARWDNSNVQVIGGPNLVPPHADAFSRLSGKALGSRLATYFSARRYNRNYPPALCSEESLTLCNLLVQRKALLGSGVQFHAWLFPNEENLLIRQLRSHGLRCAYDPDLYVFHERRKNSEELAVQVARYGRSRVEHARIESDALHWAHLIPLFWMIYLSILSVILARGDASFALVLPAYGYILALLGFSIRHQDFRAGWIVFVIHASFAAGTAWGIIHAIAPKKVPSRAS